MIVTSTSFTSPRAGALKLIDSRSVFLIRTRAILRVGHTQVGAIAVVAATRGSFLMRRFKAALRSVHTRRRSRSSWRIGVSNYTAFRASTPCSIHFWESEIRLLRRKIATWKKKIYWLRDRRIVSGGSEAKDWGAGIPACGAGGRLACRMIDRDQARRPGRPQPRRPRPVLLVGRRPKFLQRPYQIPRQGPDPIENTLGNRFRR